MSPRPTSKHETGVIALVVAVTLLVLSSLAVFYSGGNAVNEMRLASNHVRTKQAFMAAQAGLNHALNYMKNGGIDHDGVTGVDPITSTPLAAGSYSVAFCDASAVTSACPTAPPSTPISCTTPTSFTRVLVYSCGWSDDGTAVHKSTQVVSGSPGTPGGSRPPLPLIAKGAANLLTGGATVVNYFNDFTVWSGDSFLGQSNTGKTFVRDVATYPTPDPTFDFRNTGNSPACNNPPAGYICSTQGSSTGFDVIQGDPNLSTKTVNTLFSESFGTTQTDYRDNVAAYRVDVKSTPTLTNRNSTDIADIGGMRDTAIWVDGNVTIQNLTIGTPTQPVILIVNGNLDLMGNVEINGLVFVTGSVGGTGGGTVYGNITVAGTANSGGNLLIVYDPFKSKGDSPFSEAGMPGKLNGSWKDW
jgi:Tfp pilus assembly protein PilX